MPELFNTAVTGVNIIPTTLLGLVVLYWLTVILGAIDVDFLDVDFEVPEGSADAGAFQGILAFFKVGGLPLMLVFSLTILIFWIFSMLVHLLPFETGGLINGILLIPNLAISILLARAAAYPLTYFFGEDTGSSQGKNEIQGKLCTLLYDLSGDLLGKAEIERDGAPITINVKPEEGESLQKGEKALVIRKDDNKDFYIVKKFEGV